MHDEDTRKKTKRRPSSSMVYLKTSRKNPAINLNFPEIIENITDGIVIYDKQWRFIYLNTLSEKLFIKKGLIGKKIWEEFPQAKGTVYYKEFHRAVRTRQAVQFECYERFNAKWFSVNAYPFHGGLIVYYTDTTKRKQAEDKLKLSEERFRMVVEHAKELISLIDLEGKVIYLSPSHKQVLGYAMKELYGKNPLAFVHPDDIELVRSELQKSLTTGHGATTYARVRHKNGQWRYIEGSSSLIKDEEGKPKCILAVSRDITDRRRIEDELRASELRFRALTSHAPIGIFLTNAKGNYEFINERWSEITGLSLAQAKGQGWTKTLHPADKTRVIDTWQRAMAGGKEFSEEYRFKRPDGKVAWLAVNAIALKDTRRTIIGYLGTISDITQTKQTEDSLKFLTEASKVLSSSLDYQATLKSVAKLAVPHIADWCGIDLLDQEGKVQQVAVAHKDPKKVAWAKELRKNIPPDMSEPTGLPYVLRTGKTAFYPVITNDMITAAAKNKRHLAIIRQIGLTSVIIVALLSQKKPIGAITFVSAESKRPFTQADVHMAEQLASRASSAIENATLYERVKHERERMNNLVANVPGVVWEAYGSPDAANQQVDFVSNYVEKMLGYTVEQWLSTPNFWLEITHPEDKERAAKEAALVLQSSANGISRFRWIDKRGKVHWVEAQSSVIKNERGSPVGVRGVAMDITERMMLEQRKDDFISIASHELKTPVTSIKVFTQILQRVLANQGDSTTLQYLSRMEEQISKLTNLINDLLNVSKIQAGKLALRKERFSILQLTKETADTIQQTTDTHRIYVKGSSPKKIFADKDRISQVLINLLTNALKYSTKNKKVFVHIEDKGEKVIIKVRDFGIGIPKSQQQRIFERFYRVNGADDKIFPGLGMGLYISQEIVNRHGGAIWVESAPGKGSTFHVSLPVNAPTNRAVQAVGTANQ